MFDKFDAKDELVYDNDNTANVTNEIFFEMFLLIIMYGISLPTNVRKTKKNFAKFYQFLIS